MTVGVEYVDWIDLAENRNKWRAILNTVMNEGNLLTG
jgi:hypothetical protein